MHLRTKRRLAHASLFWTLFTLVWCSTAAMIVALTDHVSYRVEIERQLAPQKARH